MDVIIIEAKSVECDWESAVYSKELIGRVKTYMESQMMDVLGSAWEVYVISIGYIG